MGGTMMYRCKLCFILFLFVFGTVPASEIEIGMNISNNKWQGHWVVTPVPGIAWSTSWFRLEADGTTGSYSLSSGSKDYSLQSQWSIVPMLRLPIGDHIFAAAGYGFSQVFHRQEVFQDNLFVASSQVKNEGIFKALAGIRCPIMDGLSLTAHGGFASTNSKDQAFFGALGLEFSLSCGETETSLSLDLVEKTETTAPIPEQNIHKLTIVRPKDPVVNDLITSVEEGLLQAGIEVISWEKLKNLLTQRADDSDRTTDQNYSALNKDEADLNFAFTVAQIQDLDAILEVRMRYAFESYGGDIEVSAMSARAIQPVTGKVLWVLDNDDLKMLFSRAKKQFIADILKVMQTPKR
jgi:hypothetical protein